MFCSALELDGFELAARDGENGRQHQPWYTMFIRWRACRASVALR